VREINAKFKKEELLKVKREEHKEEVSKALQATTMLERSSQARSRKGAYGACENMVLELLEITEQMYLNCQEGNRDQID
jgi:hypothetical protein